MARRKVTAREFLFLAGEVQSWKDQGLVSPERGDAILKNYEIEESRVRHVGLLTLTGLGVFLLGLSVLLLVGYNWQHLTGFMKISVVLTTTAVVYGLGFFWGSRGCEVRSEVAFLLGAILYGVDIWQIAQVFHVTTHYPEGVWLWAVGALLLAIGTRSALTHLLAVVLLGIWMHMEMLGFGGVGPGPLRNAFPDFPNAAWSLPALVCLGFYASRIAAQSARMLGVVRLFYALLICWWLVYLPISFRFYCGASFYYVFLGTLLVLVSRLLEHRTAANRLVCVVGLLVLAGGLIPFSFEEAWGRSSNWYHSSLNGNLLLLTSLCFIAGVIAACWWVWLEISERGEKRRISLSWSVFLTVVGVYALIFQALVAFGVLSGGLFSDGVSSFVMALWQNVLMFALALLAIYSGLRLVLRSLFVFGVLYFLLWAVIRYFDLFGDFAGMLGASGLFFFCAVVMFVCARVWRYMQQKKQETNPETDDQPDDQLGAVSRKLAEREAAAKQDTALVPHASLRWCQMWLAAVVALQFVQLASMIVYYNEPYRNGQEIVVVSRPVDPRDPFRGRYVVLSYDFNWPTELLEEDHSKDDDRKGHHHAPFIENGRTVYAIMEPIAGTKLWRARVFTLSKPTSGVFLKGYRKNGRVYYGIEQFFAQENVAKEIDKALAWTPNREQRKTAHVTLSVLPDGRCAVKGLEVADAEQETPNEP